MGKVGRKPLVVGQQTKRITITVDAETYKRVNKASRSKKISRSRYGRDALLEKANKDLGIGTAC
jgi:metal-responsive CopG/Arc/MetJ family transcriptional regulator